LFLDKCYVYNLAAPSDARDVEADSVEEKVYE